MVDLNEEFLGLMVKIAFESTVWHSAFAFTYEDLRGNVVDAEVFVVKSQFGQKHLV